MRSADLLSSHTFVSMKPLRPHAFYSQILNSKNPCENSSPDFLQSDYGQKASGWDII